MGFLSGLLNQGKANKAYNLQRKGDTAGAMALYEEAWKENGLTDPKMALAYVLLLIRGGDYAHAKEIVIKTQKTPMTPDQKNQLYVDYAVCCLKLGDAEKGLRILENQHKRQPSGLMYETLGYYYVECYDESRKPDMPAFLKIEEAQKEREAESVDYRFPTPESAAGNGTTGEETTEESVEETVEAEPEAAPTAEERLETYWQSCKDKALRFNEEAVDYDDEDPICLDNLAQTWYRVMGDKEKAKEFFSKAIEQKPGQIDTLWFLSRYDLEEGNKQAAMDKLTKALEGRFSPLNYQSKEEIEKELASLKRA